MRSFYLFVISFCYYFVNSFGELLYLKDCKQLNTTETYKYNATLYVSSQDSQDFRDLLKKITIMRIPDLSNMTAFELAYAGPNPLTGGKVGFETPMGGKYLIIPTLTPDEADKLTGFIYIVSQQNPPTKFFDITTFTPNTVSLGAGESAAFFVAAQTVESTATTPGNPETTPSSTTKATPVMYGIYHSLVSNFQPPGSNSIIRIYNGTDDNSQELYSNAATPNSIISPIYLTVPFFKVSSSSQIYFSYQLTKGSPPTNISVETLPASGLISSNDFPSDGTSEYTKIEMKNAFYQWVNISVRGTFRPKGEASMLGEGFHSRVARQTLPVRDHLTLKWSVLNPQTGSIDPSQTITIEEYNETKFSYDFRGHILEINSEQNGDVPGYTAQGAYTFEYLVYETDAPPSTKATQATQGTKPPPVTDASGGTVNPNTNTPAPCPGFSYTSVDLIPIFILGIFRLIL